MTDSCQRVPAYAFNAIDGTIYTWYCETCGKFGTADEKLCKDDDDLHPTSVY
jgi:hypothetical protein